MERLVIARVLLSVLLPIAVVTQAPQAGAQGVGPERKPQVTDIEASQVVAAMLLSYGRVRRWHASATIQLIGGTDEEGTYLDRLVEDINRTIAGSGVSFRQVTVPSVASIRVWILPRAQWNEAMGFDLATIGVPAKARGHYRGDTTTATVLIDPRQFSEDAKVIALERKRTLIHEVLHVLGIPNHNPLDPDSVLYAGARGRLSTALELSDSDRKLLRFLYLHLRTGDGPEYLRLAFDLFWDAPEQPLARVPAPPVGPLVQPQP